MSGAASSPTQVSELVGKITFRERLKAWWEGTDLPIPAASRLSAAAGPTHEVRYEATQQQWETMRLRLVQNVWGEGFSSPGDAEHIMSMIKFFALDPAMSVMDLGAGLGGATRTMCDGFGVWVDGYEADKTLAEAAMAFSVKAGMGKRAAVKFFDPEHFNPKPKSADCVFSKEYLYTVKDKKDFLKIIETAMKSRGQLLFTDYVLAKPHLRSEDLDTWIEHEPHGAHPWAVEDYRHTLGELHLDIRVIQDITETFQKMVTGGWAAFLRNTQATTFDPELAPALIDEVELWTRRMQAIESGDLKVCRMHVLKRDTDKLMSNW
jgi:cyclopropane fatty-acyl-phospholipid synthase-like methyltransferase